MDTAHHHRRLYPFVVCLFLCSTVLNAADRPQLKSTDILNAADYTGGRVSPGEIIVLYPAKVGPAILAGAQLDPKGKITTSLAGTRLLFDGIPAPIAYSVQGQAGAVVPYEIYGKKTTQVTIEYEGLRSEPIELPVVSATPALFTLDSSGKGPAAMLNQTGCCNSARNPAMRGAVAVLYATGEGQTRPHGITGHIATDARVEALPVPRLPVRVIVGGKPAEIIFAGEAPHAIAGLLQVNFRVPADAPIGDAVPIELQVGTARSIAGVTMSVRSAVQRILVVAPTPTLRKRLASILPPARYEIPDFTGYAEARQLAVEHPPDLMIVDLATLDDAAVETLSKIRALLPRLKLLVVTKAVTSESIRSADLLNAEAVLANSAPAPKFLGEIRELLRPRPTPYTAEQAMTLTRLGRPSR